MSDLGSEPEENPVIQESDEPAPSRDKETNQWAMFIHFSILAGWAIPVAGLVVPIILWQLKKDELPGIVPHAHIVLNWIVSSFVYGAICMVLMLVLIGVFGLIALGIITVVYAIIGGLKANDGEIWEYPGTIIKIFK
ncbi:MAG: putative Tic20 family protein [Lysobacterales bacterium]|jgi:uncharacterized Tic20 family protein